MCLVPGACYCGGVVQPGGADEARSGERRREEVLRRKLSVLLTAALLVVMVFAVAGPAWAEGCAQPGTPLENGSYNAKISQACDGIAIAAHNSTKNDP
jgi:hypothetical protein